MRAAMNGEEFGASPEMKTFDHCTDEKADADAAANKSNSDKDACEHSKVNALNDGSTQTARRLLSSPCAEEVTSCAAKDSTRAAYESCLGPASLLSTDELKAAFVQLHSKYASETKMSDTFSAHQEEMESILQAVVEATEIAEYNRLVGIKNDKQELYDAAVSRQAAEGALARQLHQDDVDGAWEYYTSMHGSITSIATADYAYITEELESLQTVLDIVNQLNLDGNTNGEYTAAAHDTNTFATDAAEAKAAYHGGNIGESNGEGRAGEGAR